MQPNTKGSRAQRRRAKSAPCSTAQDKKTVAPNKATTEKPENEVVEPAKQQVSKKIPPEEKSLSSTEETAEIVIEVIGKSQDSSAQQQKPPEDPQQAIDRDDAGQTSEAFDTQGDITSSFDCTSESFGTSHMMQLPYFWNNGHYQHSQMLQPPMYAPHVSQQPPVTMYQLPNFNSQLPFPDRSGSMPHIGYPMPQMVPQSPFTPSNNGYPTVYVSAAGLITVLLKYDIAVELTIDKNIRVVNHRHKAVAATNARGSVNCVYHVAAKVYQEGTKTEAEIFGERRARMQTEGILFSSGMEVYLLDENHIVPSQFCFNDMSKDCSVNILFPNTEFSSELLANCEEITKNSRYYFHKNGSTTIIINNIKIHQDEFGEVQVTSGPKFITTSPVYGNIYLHSHFVEVSVQINWNVSIKRGSHQLTATYTNFVVSNGEHEAGFDQFREVFSRLHNPTVSEFENWLPSLTFMCQGIPPMRGNGRMYHGKHQRHNDKGHGAGDQASVVE